MACFNEPRENNTYFSVSEGDHGKKMKTNWAKFSLCDLRYACIGLYNGQLSFMCRLGDLRGNSNMFEAHVRMYFVHETHTQEGEVIPVTFTDMDVGFDQGESSWSS